MTERENERKREAVLTLFFKSTVKCVHDKKIPKKEKHTFYVNTIREVVLALQRTLSDAVSM